VCERERERERVRDAAELTTRYNILHRKEQYEKEKRTDFLIIILR